MANLLRSVSVVSGSTLVSRVIGFVRDVVCASVFGASLGFDAFLIAFKIPNFMRKLFGEGAFSQAFVPILSEYNAQKSEQEALEFIDKILGFLLLGLMIFTGVVYLFAPQVVMLFAPGYIANPDQLNLTVSLLKTTFPYLTLISISALITAIYNCKKKFLLPAIAPVLLNICSITAATCARQYQGTVHFIAWGVLIAGVLHLSLLLFGMRTFHPFPKPKFTLNDPGVRDVLKLMSAAIFGVSIMQLGLVIDTLLASFLPTGSVSWLYYSERLINLPLGIIAIALSTVMLPHLSSSYAKGDHEAYSKQFEWGLKSTAMLALPAAAGLIVLAKPILVTLFCYGRFLPHDVDMTAYSLFSMAIGLPAFMLIKVAVSGFYARKEIKTPVRIACYALCVDIVLSLVLMHPFAHAGLAFAVSAAAWVNSLSLIGILWRRAIYRPTQNIITNTVISFFASVFMSFVLFIVLPRDLAYWLHAEALTRFIHLTGFIALGVCSYSVVFFGLKRMCSIMLSSGAEQILSK